MRFCIPFLALLALIVLPACAQAQDETEVLPGLAPPSVSNNAEQDMLEEKQKPSTSAPAATDSATLSVLKGVNVHTVIVSAYQGNRIAQYELGLMLMNGTGVSKDVNKALTWFLRASNQGVPDAQWELAQLQLQGVTHADKSATYKWMLLSEGKNPDRIAETKKLEAELNPALIDIIQKQAASWKPVIEPFTPYNPGRR